MSLAGVRPALWAHWFGTDLRMTFVGADRDRAGSLPAVQAIGRISAVTGEPRAAAGVVTAGPGPDARWPDLETLDGSAFEGIDSLVSRRNTFVWLDIGDPTAPTSSS